MKVWGTTTFALLALLLSNGVAASELSERIGSHQLSPRRALVGPSKCPWGTSQFFNGVIICCETDVDDPLCCPLNGESCFCKSESHPHRKQGNRGRSDGCGSYTSDYPKWIEEATSLELDAECDAHDECYTNCERTHESCDNEFYDNSVKQCLNVYGSTWNPLYWWCVYRVGQFYDGIIASSAWLESMKDSCYCSSKEFLPYVEVGCYLDQEEIRMFDENKGRLGRDSDRHWNPESCADECIDWNFFALQDGGDEDGAQCWCGHLPNFEAYTKLSDRECSNDKGRTGGHWKNLVFLHAHRG